MPSTDKTKLLSHTLDKLRAKLKPATIPVQQPGPGEAPLAETPEQAADTATAAGAGPDIFHADLVLKELVRSFLIWESTTAKADAALKKIASAVVDINEFRVCLPGEMALIIGHTYPKIEDRVIALRYALNDVFKRENRLRLSHLPGLSKKAATVYLDSLSHTPGFVADRVALLCCQVHAVPVDSRIAAILEKARVIDKSATTEDAAAACARLLKAGEARDAYALLQAAADQAAPPPPSRTAKPKPPAKPARTTKAPAAARKSK